jgi:hypothetical protein
VFLSVPGVALVGGQCPRQAKVRWGVPGVLLSACEKVTPLQVCKPVAVVLHQSVIYLVVEVHKHVVYLVRSTASPQARGFTSTCGISCTFLLQASLECAIDYSFKRQSFGVPIAKLQMIQV